MTKQEQHELYMQLADACDKGNLDAVKYLVGKGANFKYRDSDNYTVFHYAIVKGFLEIVKYLVEKGADINDSTEYMPLHLAILNKHLDVVKYLIEKGADINGKTAKKYGGITPVHLAVAVKNLDIVKYLVEKGADLNHKNRMGNTALHTALLHGLSGIGIAKYLVDKGAKVDLDLDIISSGISIALDLIHEQIKMEDKWASALIFFIKEQENYEAQLFKFAVQNFIENTKTEMPDHIRIVLNTII